MSFLGTDGKLDATLVAEFIAPDLGRGIDGDLYEYREGVWVRSPNVVTRKTADTLKAKYTKAVETQVSAHLLNITLPTVGIPDLPTGYLDHIVVRNGVYNWLEDRIESHNPLLGALTRLPVHYARGAEAPAFQTWLAQVLAGDQDLVRHVWEILGYVLMTGNPLQKVILLKGEGGNGKGTLLRVIRRMLGDENYSAISLHSLIEDRFAAAGLFGKIANISGDLSSRFVNEPEILKQMTGGDAIETSRKYGQPFTFVPYAVPIFAANDYFRSSDNSHGWRRRWEVVEFTQRVTDLGPFNEQALFEEIPGIFNTAMVALRRLMERGKFDPPASALESTRQMHDAADPFMMWLDEDERVTRGDDESAPRADVYRCYTRWCDANRYKALSSGPFGARLKDIGVTTIRRREGTSRARHYQGISVSPGIEL